jgi:hypothetical protein
MKLKKGDRVKHKKGTSEWYVERVTPDGKRVNYRRVLAGEKAKTECFLREKLELIGKETYPPTSCYENEGTEVTE